MIENLRLDDSTTLTTSNTNTPSLPLTNVYDTSSKSNHLSPTSAVAYNASTAPSGWCSTNSEACDDQSRLRTDNTTLSANNTSANYSIASNVYAYGNYYNWYSATAGKGAYSVNTGNQSLTGDLCPNGWRLPIGGNASNVSNSEFAKLDKALGGTGTDSSTDTSPTGPVMSGKWRSYPNNFVLSGGVDGASIGSRSENGYFWSSTSGTNHYAYALHLNSTYSKPGTSYGNRFYGRTVRCLLNS